MKQFGDLWSFIILLPLHLSRRTVAPSMKLTHGTKHLFNYTDDFFELVLTSGFITPAPLSPQGCKSLKLQNCDKFFKSGQQNFLALKVSFSWSLTQASNASPPPPTSPLDRCKLLDQLLKQALAAARSNLSWQATKINFKKMRTKEFTIRGFFEFLVGIVLEK